MDKGERTMGISVTYPAEMEHFLQVGVYPHVKMYPKYPSLRFPWDLLKPPSGARQLKKKHASEAILEMLRNKSTEIKSGIVAEIPLTQSR